MCIVLSTAHIAIHCLELHACHLSYNFVQSYSSEFCIYCTLYKISNQIKMSIKISLCGIKIFDIELNNFQKNSFHVVKIACKFGDRRIDGCCYHITLSPLLFLNLSPSLRHFYGHRHRRKGAKKYYHRWK